MLDARAKEEKEKLNVFLNGSTKKISATTSKKNQKNENPAARLQHKIKFLIAPAQKKSILEPQPQKETFSYFEKIMKIHSEDRKLIII